jgi:hypothetical protein
MNAFGCAAVRELAPELALGVLTGSERAEALLHVNGCDRCQALVTELAETADLLPFLAPEAEPPAGFGDRTVALMTQGRRRRRLRVMALVAAVAAAAAILSIVIVRIVDDGRSSQPTATAPTIRTAPMIGANGLTAGRVAVTGRDQHVALAIDVDYAIPDGTYAVELRADGASPVRVGTMDVVGERGWWIGAGIPPGAHARVALVDEMGTAVCEATLDATSASPAS